MYLKLAKVVWSLMDGVHVAPTSKDDNYVIYSGNKYQDSQHDKHLSNNTING